MDAIINWFKGSKDYYEGVAIYAALPTKKPRLLKRLTKGKTNSNMATLVAELRKYKNAPKRAESKPNQEPPTPAIPITQEIINTEVLRKHITTESAKAEYQGILIGSLPASLRQRYSKAYNLFMQMIELKFALNDLPPEANDSALKMILEIEAIDDERDLIWKELRHWQQFKTVLPTKTDDFEGLSALQLDAKRRNIKSSITKISGRIDDKYDALDKEPDKHKAKLIEDSINRSERTLHTHNINLKKIESLL